MRQCGRYAGAKVQQIRRPPGHPGGLTLLEVKSSLSAPQRGALPGPLIR